MTSNNRKSSKRQALAAQMLMVGGALTVAPLFLGHTPLGKALGALAPIALVLLVLGAGMSVWARNDNAADASARSEPHLAPAKWGPEIFAMIEWRRFEAVVEAMFQQSGLQTKSQSHGPDGGVDVWLYAAGQPDHPASLVQCKHWHGKLVGVDKVRELRGVMAAHNVSRGVLATTSSFSPDAVAFARENGIDLMDSGKLLNVIGKRTPEQQRALLAVALEGEYWRPTCASCGIKLVERKSRRDGKAFWGCQNYPRCKTILPMRFK